MTFVVSVVFIPLEQQPNLNKIKKYMKTNIFVVILEFNQTRNLMRHHLLFMKIWHLWLKD